MPCTFIALLRLGKRQNAILKHTRLLNSPRIVRRRAACSQNVFVRFAEAEQSYERALASTLVLSGPLEFGTNYKEQGGLRRRWRAMTWLCDWSRFRHQGTGTALACFNREILSAVGRV